MADANDQIAFAKRLGEVWDDAAAAGVDWTDLMKWHTKWLGTQYGIALVRGVERSVVHNAIEVGSSLMARQADEVALHPETRRILGL